MLSSLFIKGAASTFTVFIVTLGCYLPGDGYITGLQTTKLTNTIVSNTRRKKRTKIRKPDSIEYTCSGEVM